MAEDPEYPIGYKKPPPHTQFKPGRSGNPSGRPKKDPTFEESCRKVLNTLVEITINGKTRRVPMREAIAMRHGIKAYSGDVNSAKFVTAARKPSEPDSGQGINPFIQALEEMKATVEAADADSQKKARKEEDENEN